VLEDPLQELVGDRDERLGVTLRGGGYGSIRDDETLPVREAARRLGWGAKTTRAAQSAGLRTVLWGRMRYTTGVWLRQFFEGLAD
jgi:hypothetical protein